MVKNDKQSGWAQSLVPVWSIDRRRGLATTIVHQCFDSPPQLRESPRRESTAAFSVSCWIFGQSLYDLGNPGEKKVRKTRKSELGPRLVYLDQEQCSPNNNGVQVQAAGINHSVLLIFVRSRKKKIMKSSHLDNLTSLGNHRQWQPQQYGWEGHTHVNELQFYRN